MALLDLQSMQTSEAPSTKAPKGSRASKGCGGHGSILSLLLC